jgi:MFS family permease
MQAAECSHCARVCYAPPVPSGFLRRYFVYQAAATSTFFQPIYFLYYEQRAGLSLATILALQSMNTAVRAALDLPFGALADRTSRRLCLAASSAATLLGTAVLLVRPSLVAAVVAELAFAVAAALRSGADSALLFDTLRADGRPELYVPAESRGQAVASLGAGVSAVVGGLLATWDLALPFTASIVAGALGVVVALRLDERRPEHAAHTPTPALLRQAAGAAWRTPGVTWGILLAVLAVTSSHVYFYLQQPYLAGLGVPVALFGVVFAATKLVTALVAAVAHHADARLGPRGTAAAMTLVPTLGLGAMGLATGPFGAAWILTRGVLDGLWMPLVNVHLNRRVGSRLRATLLSLQNVVARVALAATLAVLGAITTEVGVATTLLGTAAATLACGAVLWVMAPRG